MKYICPLLTVNDIKVSRDFYENLLGQTIKIDFGENVSFEGDFAIHLKTHFQKLLIGSMLKPVLKYLQIAFGLMLMIIREGSGQLKGEFTTEGRCSVVGTWPVLNLIFLTMKFWFWMP